MEKSKAADNFTPPDGGYGWIIVLATTFINISVLPLVQYFGIIYEHDFKTSGVTNVQTSFLLHLHSSIYCCLGLLGSPLLKKFDFRRVALFGTALMCLGIFLSSFSNSSYYILIFTFSVLVGIGQGIMLPATYVATNTYFKKRLTLAVSFSVTGASISSIIMPHVCNKLLAHLQSTRGTVLVLAAISLVAIFCCFLLKPIEKKTDARNEALENLKTETDDKDAAKQQEEIKLLNLNNQVYKETSVPVAQKSFYAKVYELFNLELLSQRPYVIAIIGMSISFAAELNTILMIQFILPELASFKKSDVAFAMSIQSIADITGRLGVPLLGHYFGISPRVMYANSLILSTIGRTVMAIFYASWPTVYSCVFFLGLARGTKAVYQSVIIPKYVTLEKLPAANGLNMLLTGLASLTVGPIIGKIHDVTNSFVYNLHAASILSMFCVVLWIGHFFMYERQTKEADGN